MGWNIIADLVSEVIFQSKSNNYILPILECVPYQPTTKNLEDCPYLDLEAHILIPRTSRVFSTDQKTRKCVFILAYNTSLDTLQKRIQDVSNSQASWQNFKLKHSAIGPNLVNLLPFLLAKHRTKHRLLKKSVKRFCYIRETRTSRKESNKPVWELRLQVLAGLINISSISNEPSACRKQDVMGKVPFLALFLMLDVSVQNIFNTEVFSHAK